MVYPSFPWLLDGIGFCKIRQWQGKCKASLTNSTESYAKQTEGKEEFYSLGGIGNYLRAGRGGEIPQEHQKPLFLKFA